MLVSVIPTINTVVVTGSIYNATATPVITTAPDVEDGILIKTVSSSQPLKFIYKEQITVKE